jgi:hypothetical protein
MRSHSSPENIILENDSGKDWQMKYVVDRNDRIMRKPTGRPPTPWWERFDNLWIEVENGCWIWKSKINVVVGVDKRLDPVFSYYTDGKHYSVRAARFIYEQEVGLIPDGYQIDHKCEDWRCVNWKRCLEAVTNLENNQRYRATRAKWTIRDNAGKFAGKEVMPL